MQKNNRFGKEWSSGSNIQEFPSDSQAQQGLSFLGSTPPSYNLHDAMFLALDWKDNWLFDQIKNVTDAYGQTLDLTIDGQRTQLANAISNAISDGLRNQQVANTTTRGIVELATITEAKAGEDSQRSLTPAGGMAQLDDHRSEEAAHDAGQIGLVEELEKFSGAETVQAVLAMLGTGALLAGATGNLSEDSGSIKVPYFDGEEQKTLVVQLFQRQLLGPGNSVGSSVSRTVTFPSSFPGRCIIVLPISLDAPGYIDGSEVSVALREKSRTEVTVQVARTTGSASSGPEPILVDFLSIGE